MKALHWTFAARRSVAAAGLAAVMTLTGCGAGGAEEKAAEEEVKISPVEVAEVQTSSISRVVAGEGVLYPVNQAVITPKIAGRIHALHVNRGDRVKQGQLLAELEARDLGATVTEAQAMVAQAEAAVRSASADVSRGMADLSKQQAELNKTVAELAKDQAEFNRETAGLAKDNTELNKLGAELNRQTAELNTRKASTLPEDIRKAELDLEKATATADAAKKVFEARQELLNQGALARRLVEEAGVAYTQARTDKDAAQNHLESLRRVGAAAQQESIRAGEADVEGARAQVEGARAQLDASKAQVEAAKAQITGAQAQVESTRAEVEAAKSQLEATRSQLDAAKSQLDAARARSEGANVQVSYAQLTSPIAGVVSDRPLYGGEMTGPEKPILTVIDSSRVIARANVANVDLPYVKFGDVAAVEIPGTPVKATGKVTVIAPALDPSSSTAEVWVEIENPKGDLRPGSVVHVSIAVETVSSTIVVPTTALLRSDEGDTIVLVVTTEEAAKPAKKEETAKSDKEPEKKAAAESGKKDEKADKKAAKKDENTEPEVIMKVHKTKVTIGIRESDKVQIVDGLKVGDLVVTVGGNGLEDNARVKIKEDDDDDEEAK